MAKLVSVHILHFHDMDQFLQLSHGLDDYHNRYEQIDNDQLKNYKFLFFRHFGEEYFFRVFEERKNSKLDFVNSRIL